MNNRTNRKMWVVVIVLLSLFTNMSIGFAAVDRISVPPEGWNVTTPLENAFKIQGSDKSFILLDTKDNLDSKYLILAKDGYGSRPYDPDNTQKFDTTDPNNIAYWLNHDFISSGNVEDKLPDDIVSHINYNHIWLTEGGHRDSNAPADYTTEAGIVLLSQTEWLNYITKFGVKDDLKGRAWWLRTGRGINQANPDRIIIVNFESANIGQTQQNPANVSHIVRPAFYLSRSFMSEVKLDIGSLGYNVKQTIVNQYMPAELQGPGTANYTDQELREIGFTIPNYMNMGSFETDMDGWEVVVDNQTPSSLIQDVSTWYDGSTSGKWLADFSGSENTSRIVKELDVPVSVSDIMLNIQSQDYTSLMISAVDYSGEMHTKTIALQSTEQWQQVNMNVLNGDQSSGGDQNGAFDFPLTAIYITSDRNGLIAGKSSGTVFLDNIRIGLYEDLTSNGGFENGLWRDSSTEFTIDETVYHNGGNSARAIGGTEQQQLQAISSYESHKPYEISGWIKTDNISTSNGVKLMMTKLDPNGNRVGEEVEVFATGENKDWMNYTAHLGGFSDNVAFVLVKLLVSAGVTGTAYFDDFAITPIQEDVRINMEGEPSFLLDKENVSFDVEFSVSGSIPKSYSIQYTVEGSGQLYQPVIVDVLPGTVTRKVIIDGLKNGIMNLQVNVMDGERLVVQYDQIFTAITTYQPRFRDQYSMIGVATHYAQFKQGPIETEMIKNIGFKTIRDEVKWNQIEFTKGVYDFTITDGWILPVVDSGADIIAVLDYDNVLYRVGASGPVGPKNREEVKAYADYAYATALHYKGKINKFEIWNEPNHASFWKPEPNVIDYSNLVKAASLAIKRANPEAIIIAGAVANQNGPLFLTDMLDQGVYPYIDAISFHPYGYPYDPETGFLRKTKEYVDTLTPYGGWKELYSTEVGWPTFTSTLGTSEANQAIYNVKHYLINYAHGLESSSLYDFRDDGTDITEREDTFGLIRYDYSSKPTIPAINQLSNFVSGAEFIGVMKLTPAIQSYVFIKDNEPLMVMWASESTTYDFESEDIQISDLNGNPVDSSSLVAVDQTPVYVANLGLEWLIKAAYSTLENEYANWLAKWQSVLEGSALGEGIIGEITSLKNAAMLAKSTTLPLTEVSIQSSMSSHLTQGDTLITLLEYNELSEADSMLSLNELFKMAEVWEILLFSAYDGLVEPPASLISDDMLLTTSQTISERIGQSTFGGNLKFAEAILFFAKERNVWAHEAKTAGRSGMTHTWDYTSAKLLDWANRIAEFEGIANTKLLLHAEPSKLVTYEGSSTTVDVVVSNFSQQPFTGQVDIVDASHSSVVSPEIVSLASGDSEKISFTLLENIQLQLGSYNLTIQLKENGMVVANQNLPITVSSMISVSPPTTNQVLSSLDHVNIKLTNRFSGLLTGELIINPPDDWEMEEENPTFSIDAGETTEISIPVRSTSKVPFNEYVFGITVMDSDGNLIAPEKKVLLNFVTTPKVTGLMEEPSSFNGDLSSWADAYPVFLGAPEDATSQSEWQNSNVAAKLYTKWDDHYFYLLSQVYDDYYGQLNRGVGIWDGDSVQVSFDTLNDKSSSYQLADDYEYGFALTSVGEEIFAWNAASGNPTGSMPSNWVRIIRDEEAKTTLYYARIPKESLAPMRFAQGEQFGMNIAVNDADMLSRERFIEFTGGTASSKNPSLYYSWNLAGEESIERIPSGVLSADIDVTQAGQPFNLIVGVENLDDNFSILDVTVNYDPEIVEFATQMNDEGALSLADAAIQASPNIGLLGSAIKPERGQIRILLHSTDEQAVNEEGSLFLMRGNVREDAALGDTLISLSNLEISTNGVGKLLDTSEAFVSITISLVDLSALTAAITNAQTLHDAATEGSNPGQYPVGSKALLLSAIHNAVAASQNDRATQAQIHEAISTLNTAVSLFVSSKNPPVAVDVTALSAAISAAQRKYDSSVAGTKIGHYTTASKETLQIAIQEAIAVRDYGTAQVLIDQAVATLANAHQQFSASMITLAGGTTISINDLSIIAKYFGINSNDEDWSDVVRADLFDEGEITIRVLAAIAQMILDDWLME